MGELALHDGGSVRLEVVLPEAPWAGAGALEDGGLDDASVEILTAQLGSGEPGPWLAGVLEVLAAPGAADRLDAVELAGLVAATERLAGWMRALQARASAALVAAQGGILGMDQAATVVKDRLHVTTREGSTIVNRGDRCARFPDVLDALEAGRIDVRKADTLLGAGAELTDDERAAAIQALLPEAPTRTWKWLSEQLNALATHLHGTGAELSRAAEQRNVWLETAGPGMALLTALLPAKDGARVFNAVQAGAEQLLHQPGQTRRRGQARADALTSLITGRMVPHPINETKDSPQEDSPEEEDSPENNGTPTGPARITVPLTAPGTLVPPMRDTDLLPVPAEDDGVLSTAPTPTGQDIEAGVVMRGIDVPATINITVPASVLANPSDATPAILDLLGPIPAQTARDIAGEGIWHRLVTDPVTGILTDYSTTTYQPPPRLRRAVQTRDQTCTHTGCDQPAAHCDLDHITPFDHDHHPDQPDQPDQPGQTRASNLHALCRKHHNIKTHAGWHVERDPVTGTENWTSPTGHTHTYPPNPTDPAIRYATSLTLARPPRKPPTPDKPTHPPTNTEEPPF